VLAGGLGVAGVASFGLLAARERRGARDLPLYSETVALGEAGARTPVPVGRADLLVEGTRVLRTDRYAARLVDQEAAFLGSAAAWTRSGGSWAGLTRAAVLDLRVLTHGLPGAVAGWTTPWRYVWPRDCAHVAVALARCGFAGAAVEQLRFLQGVQAADGWFEARYDPFTRRPPDRRPRQFDGAAWALWAVSSLLDEPGTDVERVLHELEPLARRSAAVLVDNLGPDGLPPTTPDYWELPTDVLTLGIAAPVWFGLSHAFRLLELLGDRGGADRVGVAADAVSRVVSERFGVMGYGRELGGRALDASVAFLCPPYAVYPAAAPVRAALDRAEAVLRRPAGGLAPGEDWRADGVSWTPQTALFALVHAQGGDVGRASNLLGWLDRHRTAAGSLPEKVLHDGRPAAVAPLAWTAALTLLAVSAVQGADEA
jgi:GH15 family glucan-1,4-alpha-glucosidase